MLFSSLVFIYLFLPTVLFLYYIIFRKSRLLQNILLLISSLVFYAWGEPKFVLVMIASIVINWLFGILADKYKGKKRTGQIVIAIDVIYNIAMLFVYKYLAFATSVINEIFGSQLKILEIALPIGISFFTFQAMSYVIDVYRGKGEVQTNILNVGLYISFFPQLIAGPIVRYETIADQIKNRKESIDDFFDGFARFIVGLAKKVILANNLALVADRAFGLCSEDNQVSVAFSWLGAIAYTLQIFFDFSGYSDMAIGLGRMFGFHFLENFNYPYISTSISEFWRRWHISLGTWFRDYIYIPLGGSRVKKSRNVFNLFVVWLLTGIWHGANWTFVIWGLLFFSLIAFEKMTGFESNKVKALRIIKWLYMLFFVMMGWVIFRSDSLFDAWNYLQSMFGINGNPVVDGEFIGSIKSNIILIIMGALACTPVIKALKVRIKKNLIMDILSIVCLVVLFALSLSLLVSNSYNPFIYFNF